MVSGLNKYFDDSSSLKNFWKLPYVASCAKGLEDVNRNVTDRKPNLKLFVKQNLMKLLQIESLHIAAKYSPILRSEDKTPKFQ